MRSQASYSDRLPMHGLMKNKYPSLIKPGNVVQNDMFGIRSIPEAPKTALL